MANPTPAAKAPTGTPPKAPTAPVPPTPKAEKKERIKWQYVFPTAEAAVAEAQKRDGGPRRPFTLVLDGKTYYIVAHNPEHAKSVVFDELKGSATELGKVAKAKKELGVDSILAALNALPEADRKAVQEALAGIKKS